MRMDDLNILLFEHLAHLSRRDEVDLHKVRDFTDDKPAIAGFHTKRLPGKADHGHIVTRSALSLGQGHHAVDGTIHHVGGAGDVTNSNAHADTISTVCK